MGEDFHNLALVTIPGSKRPLEPRVLPEPGDITGNRVNFLDGDLSDVFVVNHKNVHAAIPHDTCVNAPLDLSALTQRPQNVGLVAFKPRITKPGMVRREDIDKASLRNFPVGATTRTFFHNRKSGRGHLKPLTVTPGNRRRGGHSGRIPARDLLNILKNPRLVFSQEALRLIQSKVAPKLFRNIP